MSSPRWPIATPRPRAVLLGSYRDGLGLSGEGLQRALADEADIAFLDGASLFRDGWRLYRRGASLIQKDGFELVHVLDARLAPIAAMLRRRHGVPVTVTLSDTALRGRTPWAAMARNVLDTFDEAFVSEDAIAALARQRLTRLRLSFVQAAARELPWPSPADVTRVARALRGVQPGRLVVGVPWPSDRNDFRWFRDVVMPQLKTRPVCLLFGVPSRREVRFMLRAAGARADFRVLTGRATGSQVAAVARAVDAFAVPAGDAATDGGQAGLMSALAVGGAPVISGAGGGGLVLAHEGNGPVIDPGEERGFIASLDQLLAMPAIQRHFLGEDIARSMLHERPWRPVAQAYAERFASLLGRPIIPASLRAA
ncbi:MAG: hypothetical protein HY874_11615 [Chloroflexi bacterium]|nr:hypothetical protein [Chloroflexota bacterium]